MTTLTDKIRQCRDGVIDNPYQGKDKKVLFVCSAGILRSATGARLYASKYNTRNAGSAVDIALIPVTERLCDWADEIVFVTIWNMDQTGFEIDLRPYEDKIKVLDIPDQFEYMAHGLIQAFKDQYEPI